MSGYLIAQEIKDALAEVGEAVGAGALVGVVKRRGTNSGTAHKPIFAADVLHVFTVVLGSFDNREREGTGILVTDTKITASVGVIVPSVSDRISVLGVDYQIYGVTPLRTGGVDLMYKLWARS
jgi:hypothetical protein